VQPGVIAEVGDDLLPGGELIRDRRSGEGLFWLSPPLDHAGRRWVELNSSQSPEGFSAALIQPSRFDDRQPWWTVCWADPGDVTLLSSATLTGIQENLPHLNLPLVSLLVIPQPLKSPLIPFPEDQFDHAIDDLGSQRRIGLFPVSRPADIPCCTGWGSLGWQYFDVPPSVYASLVLRSWEERIGAKMLEFGPCHLVLATREHPGTDADAQVIGDELMRFAPEGFDDRDLAELVLTSPTWTFWWDE